jgi:hypothetical protein
VEHAEPGFCQFREYALHTAIPDLCHRPAGFALCALTHRVRDREPMRVVALRKSIERMGEQAAYGEQGLHLLPQPSVHAILWMI